MLPWSNQKPRTLSLAGHVRGRTCLTIQPPCGKLGIFNMMTQLFLKPGVLGPLPIDVGKIRPMVRAAVRLALQEDELPVAQPLLRNRIYCEKFLKHTSSIF